MRIIFICGYRDWSEKIYKKLDRNYSNDVKFIYVTEGDDLYEFVGRYKPEIIFFIGWSWIIDKNIIENNKCICLHPSPLPKYRGGSPLQHQIINGEKESAVTLFRMSDGIDEGDILYQMKISLEGNLDDIFNRIIKSGYDGVVTIIEGNYKIMKQNEVEATFHKRRKPYMSEIKKTDFSNYTAEKLHNKIRALQNPYPNAFIRCKDGEKLYITNSSLEVKNEEN